MLGQRLLCWANLILEVLKSTTVDYSIVLSCFNGLLLLAFDYSWLWYCFIMLYLSFITSFRLQLTIVLFSHVCFNGLV